MENTVFTASNPSEMSKKICRFLKELNIGIVDVSVYPSHICMEKFNTTIIVGYFKKGACVFTVTYTSNSKNIHFSIYGQLDEKKISEDKSLSLFEDIKRYSKNERTDIEFNINHLSQYADNETVITSGIDFFRDFLEKYEDLLEKKFTKRVFMWFVPEFSDRFQELNDKMKASEIVELFHRPIKQKFPEGYLYP